MTLPAIQMSERHWDTVAVILRRHVPGREVWAFGSRARGNGKTYSDLDLAIIGGAPISLAVLAGLACEFEDSALPFKVDIVDWATASDSFRAVIESAKVIAQSAAAPLPDQPAGQAPAARKP